MCCCYPVHNPPHASLSPALHLPSHVASVLHFPINITITLYMTKIKKRQANIFCAVHPQVMDIEEHTVLLIYACITGDTTPTTMLSGTRSFPLLMLFSPCLRAFIGHDGRGFKSSEGHCQIVPATLRNQGCGECTEEQQRINLQLGGNTQEVAGESMRD